MGEDRNTRFFLHAFDQALAAARHDHVERAVQAGQHHAHGFAVARRHERDGGRRQPGFEETFDQRGMDGAAGAKTLRAAAQDRGIAGLQAQRAGIGGDIRPALIDDADDAERHPHALDAHAVRPPP